MANRVFNIALGRVVELFGAGAEDAVVLLLQVAEADNTLNDHDTLDDLLTAAGNTEATFTNYARKTVSNASITITVDDANERTDVDIPDQTWTSAGNGTNNTLVKLVITTDGGSDADRIPITHHDFSTTTDGTDLTAQIAAEGFYRAANV